MRYFSPLRYPGGKAKLAGFVKKLLLANGLQDGYYAEPYAGGASVALELLQERWVSGIAINDLDPAVHAFWHSVLYETEALCQKIRKARLTPAEWRRQREVYSEGGAELLELGFAAFYLNRTNRSGIIAGAGMIGGNDQTGAWGLDARFNRDDLAERVDRIGRFRDRITLTSLDAVEFLASVVPELPKTSLIYLDPPYYVKGRRLYANFYEHEDHVKVARRIKRLRRCNWIVSYDDAPAIRSLYEGKRSIAYGLGYSANTCQQGAEVMFFCDKLALPENLLPGAPPPGARRRRRAAAP